MRTYILNLIAALFGRSSSGSSVKHKQVMHITAGLSGTWNPTDPDLKELEKQFQEKVGPDVTVIVTRDGVNVNQIYIEL